MFEKMLNLQKVDNKQKQNGDKRNNMMTLPNVLLMILEYLRDDSTSSIGNSLGYFRIVCLQISEASRRYANQNRRIFFTWETGAFNNEAEREVAVVDTTETPIQEDSLSEILRTQETQFQTF